MITNTQPHDNRPIVITSVNSHYALPLAVMLHTLEQHLAPEINVDVYILHEVLSVDIQSHIESVLHSGRVHLHWTVIQPEHLIGLKVSGHVSLDTYSRLLIEKLFPQFDKVIYLDVDLILRASISELWLIDLNGAHLLAAPHASPLSGYMNGPRGVPSHLVLGIPGDTRTLNAGVMVINLRKWRLDGISHRVITYLRKYEQYVLWWDQDGLNAILYDSWRPLPPEWNVMTNHLATFASWHDSLLSEEEYMHIWNKPKLIHYAGPKKPWCAAYDGPFAEIYRTCLTEIPTQHRNALVRYSANNN